MAAFSSLGEKLNHVFSKLTNNNCINSTIKLLGNITDKHRQSKLQNTLPRSSLSHINGSK